MHDAPNVRVREACQNMCHCTRQDSFCGLSHEAAQNLQTIKVARNYGKGSKLFMEGHPSFGVYILCEGRVKLSSCSPDGKVIILEIAEAGDILGLSSALNSQDHETSAEALEPCQASFIESSDLLRFLRTYPEACLNAAKQLSRNYLTAYRQICSLGLSDSVSDKLAKLFLGWSGNGSGPDGRVHLKNCFTHEEMAEMIGTSRETVTRALRYFRENDLVTLKGSDLLIHDRKRLKDVIGTRCGLRSGM